MFSLTKVCWTKGLRSKQWGFRSAGGCSQSVFFYLGHWLLCLIQKKCIRLITNSFCLACNSLQDVIGALFEGKRLLWGVRTDRVPFNIKPTSNIVTFKKPNDIDRRVTSSKVKPMAYSTFWVHNGTPTPFGWILFTPRSFSPCGVFFIRFWKRRTEPLGEKPSTMWFLSSEAFELQNFASCIEATKW